MKYFKNIDELPVYNWRMINETNDLAFMLIKKCTLTRGRLAELQVVFSSMYDDFIDSFGVNDDLKLIMQMRRDILVLKIKMHLEKDVFYMNFIEKKEIELREIFSRNDKNNTTFSEVKAYISKFMQFAINERETSIRDYYSYLELYKKEYKK